MLPRGLILVLLGAASICSGSLPLQAGEADDLIRLLQERRCPGCRLSDVDLVHADLRDARLQGAELQRANLGQARLDGANLSGADLSFTSLRGASLRGADLRGSRLYGTDLREADLSGAQLDEGALEQSHWGDARGIRSGARSHAALHNAGVDAAQNERWPQAEQLFGAAILQQPEEPLSWVARALCRGEQGKNKQAARDLAYAGDLFAKQGDAVKAEQLRLASTRVMEDQAKQQRPQGNGMGTALLSGALSAAQALAPIALRALAPMIP